MISILSKSRVVLHIGFALLLLSGTAQADCRGCCSRHGGVVCAQGVTRCGDGTPLSDACQAKECNRCETLVTTGTNAPGQEPARPLVIANFNIQVFGVSKAGKPVVMETLGETLTRFDLVAIQEIRDKSGRAIKALEAKVDSLGRDYSVVIGPRLGRTSSKEQYAFMYRTEALDCLASYTYDDTAEDRFHREPFIARFKVKNGDFSFVLITLHTDPDEATEEINALPDVVADARVHFADEPNILILGDLNADCAYYNEDDRSSDLRSNKYKWLIPNAMDTNLARSACTYDRIIMTAETAPYATGLADVFRFDQEFGLTKKEAKAVSDHYPVFGLFKTSRTQGSD